MSDSKWSEFNNTHLGSDDTTAVQRSTCVVPAVPSHAALAPASRDPRGAMKPNRGLALSDSDTKIPCCRFLNADGFIKFVGTDPKGAFKCDMDSPANKKIYIDQVTLLPRRTVAPHALLTSAKIMQSVRAQNQNLTARGRNGAVGRCAAQGIGVGAVVGSTMFNTMVIIGGSALVSGTAARLRAPRGRKDSRRRTWSWSKVLSSIVSIHAPGVVPLGLSLSG